MTDDAAAKLEATYFRRGKCVECGGSAERTRTIAGATIWDCNHAAEAWKAEPLRHKRCEGRRHPG